MKLVENSEFKRYIQWNKGKEDTKFPATLDLELDPRERDPAGTKTFCKEKARGYLAIGSCCDLRSLSPKACHNRKRRVYLSAADQDSALWDQS